MLEEFKDIYDIHDWLRYVTWLGFLIVAVFLLWAPGGFPPPAWSLFFQLLLQLPPLWSVQGPAILLPLLAMLFLSLLWLAGWGSLAWACVMLIRHHRQQVFERVRRGKIRWFSSQSMRRESARFSRLVIDSAVEADSLIALPKLRLPQHQSQLQSRTLSSLATVDSRFPLYRDRNMSTNSSIPASTHSLSSTYLADSSSSMVAPGDSSPLLPLEVRIGWHVGIHRQHAPNEDSVMVLQNICTYQGQLVPFSLLVVADGMGGHERGLEASQMAVHAMMHTVLQNIMLSNERSDEFFSDMLVGGVDWANRAIYQRGHSSGKVMGTTLTAALVVGMKAYVVNVGDSRTYLYREDSGLQQITRDHSVVATLVSFGEISPDEVYTHPERNKIYRSVGSDENVDVDCFTVNLCQRDTLMLCSDGLWEMVRDPVAARILQYYQDPSRASSALIEMALHSGGVDNVSVIVARVP